MTKEVGAYEDTFTTDDGIVVKKVVDGFSNGSIELDVSNITLNTQENYEWGIATNSNLESVEKWFTLGDFNTQKAKLNLTVQDNKILEILRKTDTVWLFIKNASDDTLLINALKLDLALPPLNAINYHVWLDSYYIIGGNASSAAQWSAMTYNIKTAWYKFEKITDEALVSNYKQALIEGTNVNEVFSITPEIVANKENWNACTRDNNYPMTKIDKTKIPTDQGTYYLWVKGKDADSKMVYGCVIINIDQDGPRVEEIRVSSPEAGTYKTGQTVKIRAEFSEVIKGTTVPTLKIRFGDSPVRTISNGTIVNQSNNGNWHWGHYIEYSYDIQATDVGQLATVEYVGGNIKDSSDNDAVLSCPVITGNAIKANVEGTNDNNTENQDKNNNNNTNNDADKNNTNTDNKPNNNPKNQNSDTNSNKNTNNHSNTSSNVNQNNAGNTSVSDKKDATTANKILPNTGVKFGIIFSIVFFAAMSGWMYVKYKKIY